MQHLLVYADSLSWGIIPTTRRRLEFHQRWPGVMEIGLNGAGKKVRVMDGERFGTTPLSLAGMALMVWHSASKFILLFLSLCYCSAPMTYSPCTRATPGFHLKVLRRSLPRFARRPLNRECQFRPF